MQNGHCKGERMRKVTKYLKGVFYYIIGNFIAIFAFDRCNLTGRYFKGRWGGVMAVGWKWTVKAGIAKLFGRNKGVRWPASGRAVITHPENIIFSPDDLHIFQTYGTYFQAIDAKIILGKGVYIAPNVGLITANHDVRDLDKHCPGKDIVLDDYCWIGMNSVILPGVHLGKHTIVGAGSVVTKSFPDGSCVIAGNPAKYIKAIEGDEKYD